ncbi:AraC family transcriptional regulator [Mycoplasmatota bacterium]|nr:AraC family transcriptional regulator [Mycoplasmatota bacterium]
MNNRANILKAINFIENHIKDDINVLSISSEIGYSLYHFSRLFQAVTGHSPKEYLLKRRLSEGAKDIINTKIRLTDIAFDYQFNDYETFSRAFKRVFGFNPNKLRKNDCHKRISSLSKITIDDINHMDKIKDIEPDIVELDKIYLVGLSTLVKGSTNIITCLWSKLDDELPDIKDIKKPEKFYELHYWSEKYELDGFFVMCGIETNHLESLTPMLNGKIIPKAKYLKFTHKGLSRNVGLTYKYIFQTWLPKSSYKLPFSFEFEYYGQNYLGPNNEQSESEIYIPIELL